MSWFTFLFLYHLHFYIKRIIWERFILWIPYLCYFCRKTTNSY